LWENNGTELNYTTFRGLYDLNIDSELLGISADLFNQYAMVKFGICCNITGSEVNVFFSLLLRCGLTLSQILALQEEEEGLS
jgi:hypothetical protein